MDPAALETMHKIVSAILYISIRFAAALLCDYVRDRYICIPKDDKPKRLQIIDNILSHSAKGKKFCTICLTTIESDGMQTLCKHSFHRKCLKPWLKKKLTCPMCRKNLSKAERKKAWTSCIRTAVMFMMGDLFFYLADH